MLEPIMVDHPTHFPFKCAGCGNGNGPVLDFHTEPGGLRTYLCQRCVKTGARLFGFVEGTELDRREAAIDEATTLRRENTSLLEQLGNVTDREERLKLEVKTRDEELKVLGEHVSQLENTIKASAEAAKAHLALVHE